ncbi:MAG: hypothetical protein MI919_11065 [Holophagales bacterium]|nr:hypothetical protein [Holophagales bacterium]
MSENSPRETPIARLLVLLLFAVGLWTASIFASAMFSNDWQVRGAIGDSFGAVNALFSGCGLAGIVYAILLQREDLAAQRYEIRLAQRSQDEAIQISREQTHALRLSAELSATAALLAYYLQEREMARSRDHVVLVDKLQDRIRRLSDVMEKKLETQSNVGHTDA